MNKLCTGIGAFVGGWAGWVLAERWGWGWAFVVSSIGSVVGVVLGWKLAQKLQ